MNVTLRENIFWVGSIDWTVRDFHGYDTRRGTTYNAYLLRDARTALVDTVKEEFAAELLANIRAALAGDCGAENCDGRPPEAAAASGAPGGSPGVDLIICNHAEPDHSGALPAVLRAFPRATVVCDARCRTALGQHYDTAGWTFHVVAEGDTLSLGRRTLRFIETPMLHWPESMFTYVPEEKLLFSMDAFGQHYACSARLAGADRWETVMDEARTYYANIVMPYGKAVTACLEKVAPLPIELIAPSHGLIWSDGAAEIVEAYRGWAAGRVKAKVLVLYDTMWQSTRRMAEAIVEGARQPGVEVQLASLRSGVTQIAADVLEAGAVAVGSPTLNRGPMPAAAAAMSYLRGLRPVGKAGLAFGSYGWSGGGPDALEESLRSLGWELLDRPIKAQYRPSPAVLDRCRAAGRQLADAARQRAAQ
ncbi:MAG: FprA family A-type flavoprotein [Thermoguttaceae bacterium]|jgi:flavorubredoxin